MKIIFSILMGGILMSNSQGAQDRGSRMAFNKESEPIQTVCVGRFLIEFPAAFQFSFGDSRVSGVEITSDVSEGGSEFDRRILERQKELASLEKSDDVGGLELVRDVKLAHAVGKIFQFGRQRNYHIEYGKKIYGETFSTEAHVRIGEVNFRLFSKIGDDRRVRTVEHIIANLRQRSSHDVPGQEGFCIDRGIVLGAVASPNKVESVVLFAGDPRLPDLAFVLSSLGGVKQQKSLLQRSAENSVQAQYQSRFQTFFEGRRSINGIPGEESSYAVRELKGTRSQSYMWESDAVKADVLRPFLALELSTGIGRPGAPVNSSLSDKEVQALWDKITESLRVRPTVPASSEDVSVKPPQTRASAGSPCPRAGWWSCAEHADGNEVVGGATQYFAEGMQMPEAELLGPRKVFGRRKEFRFGTATTWYFVKDKT